MDSVCAEFGHVASQRERELLASVLGSGEQVLVVVSGIVPLDLEQLHERGIGVAVATDRRVLFLRHGKSDAPVSIDLQHNAVQSAICKAGESLAEIEFQLRGGNSVVVSEAVPNWAASRIADDINFASRSSDGSKDREKATSGSAASAREPGTGRRGGARNRSQRAQSAQEPAPKKKRGCCTTGLIESGVILGLFVLLLILVGILVEVP